jgi:endogenous inhibitor of DNA gyrase (YacG/DUF329 family)
MKNYVQANFCPSPKTENQEIVYRKCTVCGMNFKKQHKRTVCSPECYMKRRNEYQRRYKTRGHKTCVICHQDIESKEFRKFCSVRCQYIGDIIKRKEYVKNVLKPMEKLHA